MIQLALALGAIAALLGGLHFVVHTIKEQGRAECRAEHAEAARMAELRTRERHDKAADRYEAGKAAHQTRERVVVQEVERIVERPVYLGACIDADGLRILRDDIAQRGTAGQPAASVPSAARPD